MPEFDPQLVQRELENFRRSLLDTSLRNRLINFRTRTISGKPLEKVVEVFGEDPAELYRILVTDGKPMSFVGKPDPRPPKAEKQPNLQEVDDHGDEASLAELREHAQHELETFVSSGEDVVDQTDLKLNTQDTVSSLQRKLTKIYRDAKVAVEEQGVNVLFLALGSLVWYEADSSNEDRRAPLLMLPVTLERTNSGAFRLKWDGTDAGGNLSIAAKLRAEFGIRLPELSDEVDVKAYFTEVAGAVRKQGRWSVDRSSVALGFFSYAKYLMYRDLDPAGWPESDKPFEHSTLGALLDCGFEENEGGISDEDFLDPLRTAHDSCDVYDADGSQSLAILEANTGRSMVVEGPPGTGKSQTITNLIAEFVAAGKKVLFIAEKAAALDVVFRRLREANLEDACLELHSNKANKRSFYTELKRTVSVAAPKVARGEEDLRKLEEAKATLNGYVRAVNEPMEGREVSPRFAMGRLISLGKEPSVEGRHDFGQMESWSETDFQRRLALVYKLQEQVLAMGRPVDHPYFGCTLDHLLPADKEDIARLLDAAEDVVEQFHASANTLAEALRVELPVRPADIEKLREWSNFVSHAPNVKGVDVRWSDWQAAEAQLRALIESGRRFLKQESQLSTTVPTAQLHHDGTGLRQLLRLGGLVDEQGTDLPTTALASLHRSMDVAATAAFDSIDAGRQLARELGVAAPDSFAGLEALTTAAKRVATGPDISGVPVAEPEWGTSRAEIDEAVEAVRRFRTARSVFAGVIADAAWTVDVASDLATLEQHGSSFFRFLNGAYKAAMANSRAHLKNPTKSPSERIAALKAIVESREAERVIAARRGRCTTLFGERWQGAKSDPNELAEVASWVQELHSAVAAGKFPAEVLTTLQRGLDQQETGRKGDELRLKSLAASKAIQSLRSELVNVGIHSIEEASSEVPDRILRWLDRDLRASLRELKGVVSNAEEIGFGGCLATLDNLADYQALRAKLAASENLARPFGGFWQGEKSDFDALESVLNWVLNLHSQIRAGALPTGLLTFFAEDRPRAGLDTAVASAQRLRKEAQDGVRAVLVKAQLHDDPTSFTEEPIAAQRAKISHWKARIEDLPSLIKYNSLVSEAQGLGLSETIDLGERWTDAGHRLGEAFERSWYTGLVREAVTQRPTLARFDRMGHEATLAEFRNLDDLVLRYNRAKVALAHWRSVPRQTAGGAMGWLNVMFGMKLNHKPIRIAMEKAGEAVQAIKPVFLMSPLSVAMYLPADGPRFDVVIFDEASQVKPEDAFGGVLRARQTIVVGDSKQMPPTSFFDKLTSEEIADDEAEEAHAAPIKELESVLALMSARLPQVSPRRRDLRWHYRSHHDGLIATSNRLFYNDRLVVFPSPWKSGAHGGLILRHDCTTVYGRGGSRKNVAEAKAVALAAQRHVQEHPKLTLGIAAFSKTQQEAIQDEIDLLRREDPAFAAFDSTHPFEPLFVKNLENVQGDERDVIYISVGYGRDENGFIPASFGPLNRDGGERRLNVLITRARIRCEVFTNIKAADVRLAENAGRGVRALKTFLAFADTGSLDVPAATGLEPQSPFEELVLDRLRANGYHAEPQVGSCGFYIDIAVRHPEQPERFVLGIECDGAMYHRAQSTRDRDKLRQTVLEKRGWRIHRIWSTDWFNNPDREFDRLVQVLQASIHVADEEREAEAESARASEYVELERDEAVTVEEAVAPYQTCDLSIDLSGEQLHELPTSDLASWVARVVEIEAPVHVDEVVRRIREAAGFARAGGRIQAAVERGIELAERQGRAQRSGQFLFLPVTGEITVRSRAEFPQQMKKLDYVADEEIATAVVQVVEHSFGIEPSEAVTIVAKKLGFDRTTTQMADRIHNVIRSAVDEGKLRSDNGLLRTERVL